MSATAQQDEIPEELRYFDNAVREYTVSALLFIMLYFAAYFFVIRKYEQRSEALLAASGGGFSRLYMGLGDYFRTEYTVSRICVYICTFTMAVAFATAFLVPFSSVANEVRLHFPDSVYLAWLNSSLIRSLWNAVSLFSNACLFVLAPFAYFLVEAEGLASNPTARSSRSPLLARIYEALVLVVILLVIICGLAWLADAFWMDDSAITSGVDSGLSLLSAVSWWNLVADLWNFHLPSLYSAVSFIAMCVSVTCTPRGFTIIVNHIFAPKNSSANVAVADSNHRMSTKRRRSLTSSKANGSLHSTSSFFRNGNAKMINGNALTLSAPSYRTNGNGNGNGNGIGHGHGHGYGHGNGNGKDYNGLRTYTQSECESDESDGERDETPRRRFGTKDGRARSSSLRRLVLDDALADRLALRNSPAPLLRRSEAELNDSRSTSTSISDATREQQLLLRPEPTIDYIPLSKQFEAELRDPRTAWTHFIEAIQQSRAEAKPSRGKRFWKAFSRVASRVRELGWAALKIGAKLFILCITIWILIQVTNQLLLMSGDVFRSYLRPSSSNEPYSTSEADSKTSDLQLQFGLESYSKLGLIGETIAVACIFYILAACLVGLYSFAFMRRFEPVAGDTPISRLLLNCVLVLLVSCVLPIQARLLGLTSFSLLGHFAHVRWLRNVRLIFVHNAVFAVAACLCFTNEYTRRFLRKLAAFLQELVASFHVGLHSVRAACFRYVPTTPSTPSARWGRRRIATSTLVPNGNSNELRRSESNGDSHSHVKTH